MKKQLLKLFNEAGFHQPEMERLMEPSAGFDQPEMERLIVEHKFEKFAELIVQECAEQIISKGTDWVDFAPSQTGVRPEYWSMAQQIKQHFGFEE